MKQKYNVLFKEYDFLKTVLATFITRIGDGIDMIAFSWLVYEITGSTLLVATIAAVNMIPTVFVGFIGGILCNYIDEKKIMGICDIGRGICVALIAFLYFMGWLEVWHLFVITFLNSSFEGFRSPSQSSIFPKILKGENMDSGMAFMETCTQAGNLIGLCVAPVCIAIFGLGGALVIDAVTFVLCALIILTMSKIEITKQSGEKVNYLQELKEGIEYAKQDKLMLALLTIILIVNALFVPLSIFQAAFVKDYLHMGSEGISLFSVTQVVAMMLTAPLVPMIKEKLGFRKVMLYGGVLLSFCMIGYGALPYLSSKIYMYICIVIVALIFGFGLNVVNIPFRIILMKHVDQAYIGRFMAIVSAFSMGMQPLASMIFGIISNGISLEIIYICVGILQLIVFISQGFNKIFYGMNDY